MSRKESIRVHTGNPIRKTSSPAGIKNLQGNLSFVSGEKFNLLITGGSQGASSINKAVSDAVALLKDKSTFIPSFTRPAPPTMNG